MAYLDSTKHYSRVTKHS